MNHSTPSFSLAKKRRARARAVNATEGEYETPRFTRMRTYAAVMFSARRCSPSRAERNARYRDRDRWGGGGRGVVRRKVRVAAFQTVTEHAARTHLVAINISSDEETLALGCTHSVRVREHERERARALVRVRGKRARRATQEISSAPLPRSSRHARRSLFTRFCGYATCRKGLPSPRTCKLTLSPGQAASGRRSEANGRYFDPYFI